MLLSAHNAFLNNRHWKFDLVKINIICRLSSISGDTGNQTIAALCDPNRPMKIAERYRDLYDNEWTDAIDCTAEVKALYPDMKMAEIEVVIIRHLYQLVMVRLRTLRSS